MIGKTLPHYRITEKPGEDGIAVVYRAEDSRLNRQVPVKVLPGIFTGDPERLARFEREAKLRASLNHPKLAAIYGLEEAEGKRFLVPELVESETPAQRIAKRPLPVDEALEACRQIAEGLETAHEKGIIHRELKPANVKFTPEGKVTNQYINRTTAARGRKNQAAYGSYLPASSLMECSGLQAPNQTVLLRVIVIEGGQLETQILHELRGSF